MKLSEAYPSKYLTAEELDNDVTVTISDVDCEEIGQGAQKSRKLVLSFQGKKKKFVVNKTNAKTIADVLGTDETDDWIGQRITIGPTEVEFQGEMVNSIRVRRKKPSSAPKMTADADDKTQDPATQDPDWD